MCANCAPIKLLEGTKSVVMDPNRPNRRKASARAEAFLLQLPPYSELQTIAGSGSETRTAGTVAAAGTLTAGVEGPRVSRCTKW
jgi:hypothetical protein